MQKKALVVIDIQKDITKNYKDIIGNINKVIDWAAHNNIPVVYIRHENLSAGTRTFKPGTAGAEFAPDLKIVSENIFTKYRGNALTSEAFTEFIRQNEISDFYITGADAVACVKSTCITCVRKNMAFMYYQTASPAMIKRKLMKCCTIMKRKEVRSSA